MKRLLLKIGVLLCLLLPSCKTVYLPSTSSTETHIKDSTVWNIKDSIRIYEATHYKEMGWLTDTLKVRTERGTEVTVYGDTLKELLSVDVKEKPIEEKTRIVYKDRLEYRDSIQVKKEYYPIEIEKEKKIYPRWMIVLSLLGVLSTLVLGFIGYLKIKKKRIC